MISLKQYESKKATSSPSSSSSPSGRQRAAKKPELVTCSICQAQVSSGHLRRHCAKVHDTEVEQAFHQMTRLEIAQQMVNNLLPNNPQQISSMTQAKKLLRRKQINIYDYVRGNYQKTFRSVYALAAYSFANRMIYPLGKAKNSELKYLLRELSSN
jgi:hypothetical protein